jgi:hypothetical protein
MTTKKTATVKPASTKTAKAKETKPKGTPAATEPTKKISQIDAALRILAKSKEPMNCQAMVEAMSAQGLWTSPGGRTPHATLYASILREINAKGKDARFKKIDRGQFTAAGHE